MFKSLTPPKPSPPPASIELYASQWAYLDACFELLKAAVPAEAAASPKERPEAAPHAPTLDEVVARAQATAAAGFPLPVESLARKNGFDRVDRMLLYALLFDALDPESPGGLTRANLCAAAGAKDTAAIADVVERLEVRGRLRSLEMLESDFDFAAKDRFYRFPPSRIHQLLGDGYAGSLASAGDAELLDRFDGGISQLIRRLSGNYDRAPFWYGARPSAPGWSSFLSAAANAKAMVAALREHCRAPFACALRNWDFSPEEEAAFVLLVHDYRVSGTGVTVGFVLGFVEHYTGAAAEWDDVGGPRSALGVRNLIVVEKNGPLFERQVNLAPEAAEQLLTGTRACRSGAESKADEHPCAYERVEPKIKLIQAILTPEVKDELTELLFDIRSGRSFGMECGLPSASHVGDGTVLLFEGPPGTGKTFTAEAVAHSLGRPLFRARFDQLLSKWVGQTEKAITGLFRDAETEGAVVVIDEADAFLGARDRASQSFEISHINVLLQELERFQGLAILTTNRAGALDPALERRLTAHLTFKKPGPEERASMWRWNMPSKARVSKEIDFNALATKWDFTGSQIRTATLRAARAAYRRQGDDKVLTQQDLETAAKRVSREKTSPHFGFSREAPALKKTDRGAAKPTSKEVSG